MSNGLHVALGPIPGNAPMTELFLVGLALWPIP